MKILNIYGQESCHADARIIGNRGGLEALKAAINRALTYGKSTTERYVKNGDTALYASDGEGYEVIVEMHNDNWGIVEGKQDPDSFWNKPESDPEYHV